MKNTQFTRVSLIPFTGILFAIWAFFGPESYGRWLGTIAHAFRGAAGF
jgi:hypothetical protein